MPSALSTQKAWKGTQGMSSGVSQGLTQGQWQNQIASLGASGSRGYNNQLYGVLQPGDPGYNPQTAADYQALMQYGTDQGWVQPHQASWGGLAKTGAKSVGPVVLGGLAGAGLAGAYGAGVAGGAGSGGGMGGFAGSSAGLGGGAAATGAGGGILGTLGITGGQAVGAGIAGLGTLYAANRASKAAGEETDLARRALDMANQPRSTQYGSSVNPATGNTFLDPSIRAMRERSLQNIPNYQSILSGQLNSSLEGMGQNRGRLEELYGQTNDNAFLDPILQNLALQRGRVSQGLTQRGLGGSSFYSQAMGNFESAAAPGVAQARQQGLQARQGILADMGNLDAQRASTAGQGVGQLQNLDNLYANVAGQNLQQELSALGLSQADIGAILSAGQQIGAAGQRVSDVYGRGLDVFGRILGGEA